MAKNDGDIIDFMLDGIFKFFGWLLGVVLKGVVNLVIMIFKGIAELFKSKKNGVWKIKKNYY